MDDDHDMRLPRLRRGGVIAVLLPALVTATGCASELRAESPRPAPTTTRSIEVTSDEPTTLEAGTYRIPTSAWSVTDFTVTLPEGWAVQYGHVFSKHARDFYGLDRLWGSATRIEFPDVA